MTSGSLLCATSRLDAVVAARLGLTWIMLDKRWLTLLQDVEMRRVVPLFVLDHDGLKKFVREDEGRRSGRTLAAN
jgi:hypothetical protein